MTNDVTKFFGAHSVPANSKDLVSSLASLASAKNTLMGQSLLRLARGGVWVCGQNNEVLDVGTTLVVNPASMQSGYIAWYGGAIEEEVMQNLSLGPVDASTLKKDVKSGTIPPGETEADGNGWETQLAVDLITQDEVPLQLVYKVSSQGGIRAILTLAGDIAKGVSENSDRVYPIVELSTDSYMHKKKQFGEVFTPELIIIGWLDAESKPVSKKASLV